MIKPYIVFESINNPGKFYAGEIFFNFEEFHRAMRFPNKKNLQYHIDKASKIEPFKMIEIYAQ
jgi:hypothetical protein